MRALAGPVAVAALAVTACNGARADEGASAERAPVTAAPVAVETSAAKPSAVAPSAPPPRCPTEMALIDDAFCIDRWEGHTLEESGEIHSPYIAVRWKNVRAASAPGVVPQGYISPEEADDACRRANKRLCTTVQWVAACMGKKKRPFPYGPKAVRGRCNVHQRIHPTALLHDGRRKEDAVSLNDPRINQIPGTVAPTGAFEDCVTPEGVADMHGNLLEWTRGEKPLLMGGHYLDGKINGIGCAYVTDAHGPKYHDFTTGFRCCSRPADP